MIEWRHVITCILGHIISMVYDRTLLQVEILWNFNYLTYYNVSELPFRITRNSWTQDSIMQQWQNRNNVSENTANYIPAYFQS